MKFQLSQSDMVHFFRLKDEIYSCFQENTEGCNSIEKAPLQYFLDWFLSGCSVNETLLADDIFSGIARCKLQYGYNLYQGFQTYSG